MENTFNSNFYLAAATVIPVLYIALIVQANAVRDILTRLDHAMYAKIRSESHSSIILLLMILGLIAAFAVWLVSVAILIFGIVGEITSIQALYHQSDSENIRFLVLVSTILLLAISTVGPALTVSIAFARPIARWTKAFVQVLQNLLSADQS